MNLSLWGEEKRERDGGRGRTKREGRIKKTFAYEIGKFCNAQFQGDNRTLYIGSAQVAEISIFRKF